MINFQHNNRHGLQKLPVVPVTPFWLVVWAVGVSLAWLLPNHYPPWTTFHLDAWMACSMLAMALWLIWNSPECLPWMPAALFAAVVCCIPMLQYAAGLLIQAGNAWVSTAYLVGFLLACLIGARWESTTRGQLSDGLFLAIGIAAFVSVGLQLHQWLQLERLGIWYMGGGQDRPFANLGQPNQLGTLLLWGLLALAWGTLRKRIGAGVAVAGAVFLLFGVALAGSRTAWLGIALLTMAAWVWRSRWPSAKWPWVVATLAVYFCVCVVATNWLHREFFGEAGSYADIVRISNEARPAIWALFLDAVMQHPWFGYGWNQVAMAHMTVAGDHPPLHEYFAHSHNLFLDLVLWCGLPIGLAVSANLLWWMASRAWRIRLPEDAILFMLLVVIANHAMLELPLHHAYFLLPVGMVMGALDVRLGTKPIAFIGRWAIFWIWLVAAGMLGLIIRDYSRVEATYQTLRYQWARIKTTPIEVPDVVLLTQWRDFVRLAKLDPDNELSEDDLKWMENVTSLMPNIGFFQLLAAGLAKRGHPEEAAKWLNTMCSVVRESQCNMVKSAWANRSSAEPVLALVPWPVDSSR